MAAYPSSLLGIIRSATDLSNAVGVDKATDKAYREWTAHEDYPEWISEMVRRELRTQIHECRHRDNTQRKRAAGEYGGPAKVTLGSGVVNRVARESLLEYSIAGRCLGDLYGKEIIDLAASEEKTAAGSLLNARLLRAIKPLVGDDERVRDAVSESKAKSLFKSVNGNTNGRSIRVITKNTNLNGHSSKHANGKPINLVTSSTRVASVGKTKPNGRPIRDMKPAKPLASRRKQAVA